MSDEGPIPARPLISINELAAQGIESSARREGYFAPLIGYLKEGRQVTPALNTLLVDILEGRCAPSSRQPASFQPVIRNMLREMIRFYRDNLASPTPEDWVFLERELKAAGHLGEPPVTFRERSKAARAIVKSIYRLSDAQLDERLRHKARRDR